MGLPGPAVRQWHSPDKRLASRACGTGEILPELNTAQQKSRFGPCFLSSACCGTLRSITLFEEETLPQSLPELDIGQLTVPQRLELIPLLWDSNPDSVEALPVPEGHRQELERRLAAADAAPEAGIPWEQVRARLRSKLPRAKRPPRSR